MTDLEKQQAEQIIQLTDLVRRQEKLIEAQARKIEQLEHRVDQLAHKIYGKSSEQIDWNQLQLELEGVGKIEAVSPEELEKSDLELAAKTPKKARKQSKPRLPDNLPVVTEVLIPLQVQANPEGYEKIGEKVTERLDIEPAKLTLKRTVRPSYKAKEDNSISISPLPPCLLEKSILTPSLLSYILCSKYCDHLPLDRQEKIFQRRYGVQISRSTMCDWVNLGAEILEPVYKKLARQLRHSTSLQIDETPVKYLTKSEGSKQGYFWIYANQQEGILYDWKSGRGNSCLDSILSDEQGDFQGLIQCDGYEAYSTWAKKHGDVKLMGCWVHVRRKFHEARQQHKDAFQILHYISKLYRLDQKFKEWLQRSNHAPESIRYYRKRYSRVILKELRAFLQSIKRTHLPKSPLGKAVSYTLNQWEKLGRSVSCSPYDLDNNYAENAVRPLKLGAKNWLFIGADQAGWRSAVIYTMIENIRKAGKDPYAYLKWLFEKLPSMTNQDDLDPLMPKVWLAKLETEDVSILAQAS